MKNKFNILVVVISTIITVNTQAQYSVNSKKFQELELTEQVIYFETKTLSEKQIYRLQKRDAVESIEKRYEIENNFLKKLLTENWEGNNTIKAVNNTELSSLVKNKEDIWYITLRKHTDKFFDRRVHKKRYYYNFSHYEISLYNDKKEVLSIPLVDEELSELNSEFAIQQIQSFIKKSSDFNNQRLYTKEVNGNAGLLSTKTLLVSNKLTGYSEDYLQKFFDGNIKIVSEDEILMAVEEKDENKAYLLITINDYSDKPSFNHLIIDCSSNEPVLIYRNSTAYSKPCEHSCIVHNHNDKLEFLFGFHFKKYRKLSIRKS